MTTDVKPADYSRGDRRGPLRVFISIMIWLGLVGGALFALLYFVFGTVVPPNRIGVRINYFSFGVFQQGYSRDGLAPGLHVRFPGLSDIVLLPRDFQFVSMSADPIGGELQLVPLQVQSSNGPRLNVDSMFVTRWFADQDLSGPTEVQLEAGPDEGPVPLPARQKVAHGGPSDLITYFGFDPQGQLSKFARIAQNELSKALNELASSDFYDPVLRERAVMHKAYQAVNRLVNPQGVEVWAILLGRYVNEKEEIDNQIFAKNLQTQTARLRIAQTGLAEVTAQIDKTRELWTQKIVEKSVEASSYLVRKEAEARFFEETKIAEGEQELKTRSAEITSKKNRLLSELPGADVYIAREMVPLLRTLGGGVVSDVDPYNIDAWVDRLLGGPRSSTSPRPAVAAGGAGQ